MKIFIICKHGNHAKIDRTPLNQSAFAQKDKEIPSFVQTKTRVHKTLPIFVRVKTFLRYADAGGFEDIMRMKASVALGWIFCNPASHARAISQI